MPPAPIGAWRTGGDRARVSGILPPLKHARRLAAACTLAMAAWMAAPSAASKDLDEAFKAFWDARSPQAAARIVPDIVKSGVAFDEAFKRLQQWRPYAANVRRGVVKASYQAGGQEFFY